ncbi:MAG: NAD(P)-dependent oxidoreductase [Deltaproteobacteria bacterium]|jgi:3-hydroxyisobutyrate dehydrogenase-like beta-hydroxyacid dehydrogenase|nr:NAD(P)-dependent oxidoreductase [Deltaproteobacteria bacterium]
MLKTVFIGLGRMGSGMARRILDSGLPLEIYNRDPAKSAPFGEAGAKVHRTLEEAMAGAGIVFTMLSDDQALRAVVNPATMALAAPGATHVSMSTAGVAAVLDAAQLARETGRRHLSSPVFGRPPAAASGTLKLCVSGDPTAREAVSGYLASLGEIWDFGEDPAAAAAVKIAGNFMIASLIETLSEAFSLAENHGVSPEAFFRMMSGTLFAAPAVKTYGELILKGAFDEAGFSMALGAKDAGLVREAARLTHTPMAFASILEDRFLRAMARGWDAKDWCAISALQREDAWS